MHNLVINKIIFELNLKFQCKASKKVSLYRTIYLDNREVTFISKINVYLDKVKDNFKICLEKFQQCLKTIYSVTRTIELSTRHLITRTVSC